MARTFTRPSRRFGLPPRLALLLASAWPGPGAAQWDYRLNGKDWGGLGVCGNLGAQSPVNLPEEANQGATKVFLKYPHLGTSVPFYNNGKSLAITLPENYAAGFALAPNAAALAHPESLEAYRLWQVTFHSPAEHLINGHRPLLEMQLMHQRVTSPDGLHGSGLAAIVVLFDQEAGKHDKFLDILTHNGLPSQPWDEVSTNTQSDLGIPGERPDEYDINFQDLLEGSSFYSYEGSLTMPPCEDKVRYLVRQQTLSASAGQLEPFRKLLRHLCPPFGNYREVPEGTTALNSGLEILVGRSGFGESPSERRARGPRRGAHQDFSSLTPPAAMGVPEARHILEKQPDLDRILGTDSDELVQAKGGFATARANYANALAERANAVVERDLAKKEYEAASGLVRRLRLLWTLKQKQAALTAARQRVQPIEKVFLVYAIKLAEVYKREKKASTASTNQSSSEPAAERRLNYFPRVSLPRGLSASPFAPERPPIVEELFRATPCGPLNGVPKPTRRPPTSDSPYARRLAPNLQQPDTPYSAPPAVMQITTAAPTLPPESFANETEEDFLLPAGGDPSQTATATENAQSTANHSASNQPAANSTIVEPTSQAQTAGDCPWLTPMPKIGLRGCADGTECEGMFCCNSSGGTSRCPAEHPFMCADKMCNGGEYCCSPSQDCHTFGGPRPCQLLTANATVGTVNALSLRAGRLKARTAETVGIVASATSLRSAVALPAPQAQPQRDHDEHAGGHPAPKHGTAACNHSAGFASRPLLGQRIKPLSACPFGHSSDSGTTTGSKALASGSPSPGASSALRGAVAEDGEKAFARVAPQAFSFGHAADSQAWGLDLKLFSSSARTPLAADLPAAPAPQ